MYSQKRKQLLQDQQGKDIYWHDLVAGKSEGCECEKMDSGDRLFILYISGGTTGKPKGIEHVHGGYQVGPAQTLHWVHLMNFYRIHVSSI